MAPYRALQDTVESSPAIFYPLRGEGPIGSYSTPPCDFRRTITHGRAVDEVKLIYNSIVTSSVVSPLNFIHFTPDGSFSTFPWGGSLTNVHP